MNQMLIKHSPKNPDIGRGIQVVEKMKIETKMKNGK